MILKGLLMITYAGELPRWRKLLQMGFKCFDGGQCWFFCKVANKQVLWSWLSQKWDIYEIHTNIRSLKLWKFANNQQSIDWTLLSALQL